MKQNRRQFLKTAALGAAGSGVLLKGLTSCTGKSSTVNINRTGLSGKLKMTFEPYDLKLKHVFTVSSFSRTSTPTVQVRIDYDGIIAYGEASMPPYLGESTESVMGFLQKVDLGQFNDPFRLEDILTYVDGIMPGNGAAKASVDIALHDLVGKLLNAPWYKIWGLDKTKAPDTTYTIGIDTADVVREKTEEVANDFNILKVKLGGPNDKEMIETVRAVTDVPLIIDVNQGWTDKHYALDMIHWLKEQGIVMVEQPLPKTRLDDIAWITERSPLPIFADESLQRLDDIMKLRGAFTGINIKLMKCTGMREAWKMLTLGRALGMGTMVGCMMESSIAISAASQLSPGVDFADLDGSLLSANDNFKGMEVMNGKVIIPDSPGIGAEKI